MAKNRRIALVLGLEYAYFRAVCTGLCRYVRPLHPWTVNVIGVREFERLDLHAWHPDGVIASLTDTPLVERLATWGGPVINIAGTLDLPHIPQVTTDNHAVGRLAAQALLDRGFRSLAFVGRREGVMYSRIRRDGFVSVARDRAVPCQVAPPEVTEDLGSPWHATPAGEAPMAWLRALPRPTAIFTSNDVVGLRVCELCREIGLHVPEDLAILGVDNDEVLCQTAYPPLASIRVPAEQIGHRAGEMMDAWLEGQAPAAIPVLLPPSGLAERQSIDVLAVRDPLVAAAVRFLHRHHDEPISIDDLLRAVPANRRTLERRFRALLGRSPHEELRRVRLDRACHLLAETDLPLPRIATQCGFTSPQWMATVFREVLGTTPAAYRQQHRSSVHDGHVTTPA